MNNFHLTGRLTRDAESRATSGGQEVCAMRLAVDGPREADTVFVDVTPSAASRERAASTSARAAKSR